MSHKRAISSDAACGNRDDAICSSEGAKAAGDIVESRQERYSITEVV